MIAKCGKIVIPHWAHAASEACDPWRQGETPWHLQWKQRFLQAGARVEVRMERDNEVHIADVVVGPPGAEKVIELAGVYPPAGQIAQREAFYGPMAWIYNDFKFIDRVEIYYKGWERRFRFKQPVKVLTLHQRPVFWTSPEEDTIQRVRWIRRFKKYNEYEEYTYRTYGRLDEERDVTEFIHAEVAEANSKAPMLPGLDRPAA